MKQYAVLKLLGFHQKKFHKFENALKFWEEHKDYNSIRELIPVKKLLDGKHKTIYRSKFLKGRFHKHKQEWKGEDYWRYKR